MTCGESPDISAAARLCAFLLWTVKISGFDRDGRGRPLVSGFVEGDADGYDSLDMRAER